MALAASRAMTMARRREGCSSGVRSRSARLRHRKQAAFFVGSNRKHEHINENSLVCATQRIRDHGLQPAAAQPHLPPGRYSSTSMYGFERVHAPRNCTRFGWCICTCAHQVIHTTAVISNVVPGKAPAPEAQDVAP
jgi:hypothetical protein